MKVKLRTANSGDGGALARLFSRSFGSLTFLPTLHTDDQQRRFIADIILPECEVTVAERQDSIVSFLARDNEEIRLLYTDPNFIGQGAGSLLLVAAKNADVAALELWCFQANAGARRFYEARGFRAVEFTDGSRNEEKTPDMRYRWERLSET